MAANINRVVLVGNLTKDPELRHTPSGTPVCSLRLAVNTRRKDGATGEWTEKPNYFDITVWGNQGESCAQYLAKGRPVAVDGRLQWREWDAQDGTKRQAVEIIAESVQFLGGRQEGELGAAAPSGNQYVPAAAAAATTEATADFGGADDDIPFSKETEGTAQDQGLEAPVQARGHDGRAGEAPQLLLLQGEDRRGRLQELPPAPPLRVGEGEDPLAPHHRRVPPPPAADRRRRQARPRERPAPLR